MRFLIFLVVMILAAPLILATCAEQCRDGGSAAGVLFLYFVVILWGLKGVGMAIVQAMIGVGLRMGGKDDR